MRIISGYLGGRILKTVEGKGYRPAMGKVREALFSLLEARGIEWEGVRVLDVYAGSGSLGFEAVSRGATLAVFIELDKNAALCLEKNIKTLGVENSCKVIKDDVGKVICKCPQESYHLVFVDPPYGEEKFLPTLKSLLRNKWLAKGSLLIAEVEGGLKFKTEIEGLTLEIDRPYGQTRILIWSVTEEKGENGENGESNE